MTGTSFQRARTAENKQRRADALVEAARALALEAGVASVTLTAVADRAGVHHSAVRRYFGSHKDVLLTLAEQGWVRWSTSVCEALAGHDNATPASLAEALVGGLTADPLFCDLLANVPLHLERDVEVERVRQFKRRSHVSVLAMVGAVESALPGLGSQGALDVVLAANALAATLWQVSHPPEALMLAYAEEPAIARTASIDFAPTLNRLLSATCHGLLDQPRTAET